MEGFIDEIHVKIPIGFSFNVDYGLNEKLRLKSRLDDIFQTSNKINLLILRLSFSIYRYYLIITFTKMRNSNLNWV